MHGYHAEATLIHFNYIAAMSTRENGIFLKFKSKKKEKMKITGTIYINRHNFSCIYSNDNNNISYI